MDNPQIIWLVVLVALYLMIGNAMWHYIKVQAVLPKYSGAQVILMRVLATLIWLPLLIWVAIKGR